MENKNQITVCIQCMTYNHEKYLADALEGFVMQKTDFPFVAVVIDDCSTDGTADVLRSYEEKYPEIIKAVYLKENYYSQHKSKQPFLEPWDSKAKYIALCEGDDYWTDPLKLQKQVDFLESHPEYGFIGSNCWIKNSDAYQKDNDFISDFCQKTEEGIELFGNMFEIAKYGPIARTCSILFRKDIVKGHPYLKWGDLTLEAFLSHDFYFARLKEESCVYRVHSCGISHNRTIIGQLHYLQWLKAQHKYLSILFPNECPYIEEFFDDKENYIRLKYAIYSHNFSEALSYKRKIHTSEYKNKSYYRFFTGPISMLILAYILKKNEEFS